MSGANAGNIYLLLGTEPSRSWKRFTAEVIDAALAADIGGIVFLGAMLADVPHTRPISIFASSDNAQVRAELDIERSNYEGPVGILSVIAEAAEKVGHPDALDLGLRAALRAQRAVAEGDARPDRQARGDDRRRDSARRPGRARRPSGSAASTHLAGDDDEMASYIAQLEQARDTVDSPEASGEAIAQEFEQLPPQARRRP